MYNLPVIIKISILLSTIKRQCVEDVEHLVYLFQFY